MLMKSFKELFPRIDDPDFFHCLTKKEESVLRFRVNSQKTLEEVGNLYSVTRERIRQIEIKAHSKLLFNLHALTDFYPYYKEDGITFVCLFDPVLKIDIPFKFSISYDERAINTTFVFFMKKKEKVKTSFSIETVETHMINVAHILLSSLTNDKSFRLLSLFGEHDYQAKYTCKIGNLTKKGEV